ncbi:MAG: NOB1 family endonuclease [Candidatus Hodarchaeales archaeon]
MSINLVDYSQLIHVLDTTAFIGLDFPILQTLEVKKFLTAHSVIEEIKDFRSKMNLEVMLQSNELEILSPNPKELKTLTHRIHKLEPKTRLSNTDIQVLALARQVKGVLVSNDLTMQNMAKLINIPTRVVSGKKVTAIRRSHLRCLSCKRTFQESDQPCPACGGELKQYFTKSRSKDRKGKE